MYKFTPIPQLNFSLTCCNDLNGYLSYVLRWNPAPPQYDLSFVLNWHPAPSPYDLSYALNWHPAAPPYDLSYVLNWHPAPPPWVLNSYSAESSLLLQTQ